MGGYSLLACLLARRVENGSRSSSSRRCVGACNARDQERLEQARKGMQPSHGQRPQYGRRAGWAVHRGMGCDGMGDGDGCMCMGMGHGNGNRRANPLLCLSLLLFSSPRLLSTLFCFVLFCSVLLTSAVSSCGRVFRRDATAGPSHLHPRRAAPTSMG